MVDKYMYVLDMLSSKNKDIIIIILLIIIIIIIIIATFEKGGCIRCWQMP